MPYKLKPCPFCGIGENEKKPEIGVYMCWVKSLSDYYVECGACGAIGPMLSQEKLAAKKWNRRAPGKD